MLVGLSPLYGGAAFGATAAQFDVRVFQSEALSPFPVTESTIPGNEHLKTTVLASCVLVLHDSVAARGAATIFKTAHYASRLEAAGVNVARAESAVAKAVGVMRPNMAAEAAVRGRMTIDGVLVEYRAMLLPDGAVNVGTIFPVVP